MQIVHVWPRTDQSHHAVNGCCFLIFVYFLSVDNEKSRYLVEDKMAPESPLLHMSFGDDGFLYRRIVHDLRKDFTCKMFENNFHFRYRFRSTKINQRCQKRPKHTKKL